jgi:copper(I)-binding protein
MPHIGAGGRRYCDAKPPITARWLELETQDMRLKMVAAGVLVSLSPTLPADAATGRFPHENPPASLVVEHAELLVADAASGRAEGFLTIWNGTSVEKRLIGVASEAFRSVAVLPSPEGMVAAEEFVPIPAHAELRMKPTGLRLLLADRVTGEAPPSYRLTLTFEDGTRLAVTAAVVRAQAELTRHHHGQADPGPGNGTASGPD